MASEFLPDKSQNRPGKSDKQKSRKKKPNRGPRKSSGPKTAKTRKPTGDSQKVEEAGSTITAPVRLNRYIAMSGLCSRREADDHITNGLIKINGKMANKLGVKVYPGDKVTFRGKPLKPEKPVYVLLNKPKDFITTVRDTHNRRTVIDLVKTASEERTFPVGRLDRNTTGLLLLTNDGELTKRLTHPSHKVKKVYHVHLDKPLTSRHYDLLAKGLELEDGKAEIDKLEILTEDRQELGIEIHIGKNRIVRRLFEKLEYDVVKLDRVIFAGLTKKDLPRGKWRYLTEKEIIRLKHF